MRLLKREQIEVKNRQRREILPGPLEELKQAILSSGLLHPVVVAQSPENAMQYSLVCGERRLRAIEKIAEAGLVFRCDGQYVSPGHVPTTDVSELNEDQLFEAELLENLRRV